MEKIKDHLFEVRRFSVAFAKWLLIAAATGLTGGLVGSAFSIAIAWVTTLRLADGRLLWLLPAAGLLIAGIYSLFKAESKNTNVIFDAVQQGRGIPAVLVPVIFVSTCLTHLCGGSAGREGAALQIGGGLGCAIGKVLRLDDKDRRVAVLCGMSAVFSALFGTPLTAALFALEVISVGLFYHSALLPCLFASLTAYGVTRIFSLAPTRFVIEALPQSFGLTWRVAVLGILCAIVSILFCRAIHSSGKLCGKYLPNPYIRAFAGGCAIIALTYLCGVTDYNGAGSQVIQMAVEQGQAAPFAWLLKLLFTAVTLGCGFKGGEVVPTFFVGATFGCVVGPLLGLPAGVSAAIALVSVFCGAVNCPLASIAMSVEIFGASNMMYFAIACVIAYMLSGYTGLYSSQKILYSKLKAEFIDIHAE